jgi:hypothetical protein
MAPGIPRVRITKNERFFSCDSVLLGGRYIGGAIHTYIHKYFTYIYRNIYSRGIMKFLYFANRKGSHVNSIEISTSHKRICTLYLQFCVQNAGVNFPHQNKEKHCILIRPASSFRGTALRSPDLILYISLCEDH